MFKKIYIKYFIFGLSQYYNFKLNTDIHKNTRYHFWNHKKDSDPILQQANISKTLGLIFPVINYSPLR